MGLRRVTPHEAGETPTKADGVVHSRSGLVGGGGLRAAPVYLEFKVPDRVD